MYLIKQGIDAHVSSQVPTTLEPYNIWYLDIVAFRARPHKLCECTSSPWREHKSSLFDVMATRGLARTHVHARCKLLLCHDNVLTNFSNGDDVRSDATPRCGATLCGDRRKIHDANIANIE